MKTELQYLDEVNNYITQAQASLAAAWSASGQGSQYDLLRDLLEQAEFVSRELLRELANKSE